MKLPNKSRGFTLIELLVVIAIIAILATVGLVIYSNVQKNARDARRRADIEAISKAMENHYNTSANANCTAAGGTYCALSGNWFSSNNNQIPVDPQGGNIVNYCVWSDTNASDPMPANPAAWSSSSGNGCPTNWSPPSTSNPLNGSVQWKLCAQLETTGGVTCLSNQQQ